MERFNSVCERYQISRPTLYAWITQGCPSYKKNGIVFFDISEVDAWIKQKAVENIPNAKKGE
jgi:predicted DNA-binding transcriptional regulator AlpA